MSAEPTILVIEDESPIRKMLQMTLEPEGYRTRFAVNGEEGMVMTRTERSDLVLLDLGLPDIDGARILSAIREWSQIPVIIISVRAAESDIIACLDAGADDYLVKPFRTGELLARIRTALRRHATAGGSHVVRSADLVIDLSARSVRKKGEIVKLTAIEYSLLALFAKNAGRVLTHRFILEQVWGPASIEEPQYTRVFVRQLRKKIEDDPANPTMLLTESGIGYRLILAEGGGGKEDGVA